MDVCAGRAAALPQGRRSARCPATPAQHGSSRPKQELPSQALEPRKVKPGYSRRITILRERHIARQVEVLRASCWRVLRVCARRRNSWQIHELSMSNTRTVTTDGDDEESGCRNNTGTRATCQNNIHNLVCHNEASLSHTAFCSTCPYDEPATCPYDEPAASACQHRVARTVAWKGCNGRYLGWR